MKKLLAVILFLSSNSFCQNYIPLPIENVIWEEYEYLTYNPCVVQTWRIYYTDGDTTISSIQYQKLFYESNRVTYCGSHAPPGESIHPRTYSGALRQDTSAEKVFFVASGQPMENLLYDFTLQDGDSIFMNGSFFATVDSVDSIIIQGFYHKRIWYFLEYPYEGVFRQSTIIEGIGNNRGLIDPISNPYNWYNMITCVSVDNINVYGGNGACCQPGDTCGTILPSPPPPPPPPAEDSSGITFSILYQYSVDGSFEDHPLTIHINHPSDKSLKLVMYNLNGNLIMSKLVSPHESFIISHANFAAGIYFFVLLDNESQVGIEKLFWP